MTKLDIDFVRSQFPAFQEPALEGQAFFECAGGSYPCVQVVDRLTRFYRERKVQPYWDFQSSRLGGEEMDEAQVRLAAMLGVETDELSFGPSTTQNTYVLSQAFRQHLSPGDAIIVTNQDHEANSGPWRRLAESGIEVREWTIDPDTGHLDRNDLVDLMDEKTRLVCFPHCSNVIGEINDVKAICSIVRDAGAYSCVDGVSYAPHGFPDVGDLGADIYLFSAYKTFGPHQGIMAIRREVGMTLPNQGHYFNEGSLYKRFTPAGPDHAQVAASAGMVDYIEAFAEHHGCKDGSLGKTARNAVRIMQEHEETLLEPLLDYAGGRDDVRLLGPRSANGRAPTLALDLGRPAAPVAAQLAEIGINCGGDHFYAVRALEGVGIDPEAGVLRVSFVHYTSKEEVARLIEGLDRVI